MKISISKLEQLVRFSLGSDVHSFITDQNSLIKRVKFYYLESKFVIDNYFMVTELIDDIELVTPASKLMTKYFYLEHKDLIEHMFKNED